MKRFQRLSLSLLALSLLVACGNDNKSGKNNTGDLWGINQYGIPQTIGSYPVGPNGLQVATVIAENPCKSSYGYTGGQRIPVQIPLTSFPSTLAAGTVHVGVTDFGDVAAIVGTGSVPTFIAYICPRSQMSGAGQLSGISLGAYTRCQFPPISSATMRFPDMTEARFRMLDFGSSQRVPFSFCR